MHFLGDPKDRSIVSIAVEVHVCLTLCCVLPSCRVFSDVMLPPRSPVVDVRK